MRKLFAVFTLLLAAVLLLPPAGVSQDKKDKKNKTTSEPATAQDYTYLGQMKDIQGKIAAVDVKAGTITLTVEFQHWELNKNANLNNANANAAKLQQQVLREYNQIMTAKNPVQRQQALLRLQQTMMQMEKQGVNLQKMFHVVTTTKDFDLEPMDTLKVARSQLEMKYDENTGELIKYSDEELKKMKSPDISGAYTASPDDLKTGQSVKLYLSPPKKKAKDDPPPDGDKSQTTDQSPPPRVRMALITAEAPDMPDPKTKKDKKKN
jgi:hypothetical protein